MQDHHPLSPEDRRKRLAAETAAYGPTSRRSIQAPPTAWEITKRIAIGVYNDGFIHAGNLAFLSILALFPFFILATAIAQLLGQSADGAQTVATILAQLPPQVAGVLAGPINEVLTVRTGTLLWLGAAVGLWTAASYIETIRDILRRAYGVKFTAPFWTYRLLSSALILAAVLLLMAAFGATVVLTSIQHFVVERVPGSSGLATTLGFYRIAPAVTLFVDLLLHPAGADPVALSQARVPQMARRVADHRLVDRHGRTAADRRSSLLGGYEITYGSLAGVMVALLFFFVIGLGVVTGAELNAALADPGAKALKGEVYAGPYVAALPVEEPAPDEDIGECSGEIEGVQTMSGLMAGKRGLIMGLANDQSLAWGIAKQLAEQGAELAFSYQGEALGSASARSPRSSAATSGRLRRQRHGRARPHVRRSSASAGTASTSSSTRSAFPTRTSFAAAMSTPVSTIS